ncbi:VacJ family lipoprotein [Paracoccus sp. M683]|uniref:MlaA family lipoprotein n=2 Tax=Paracoccus TaxID=265 RepID=UPI002105BF3A|nr:VacJ family lipoprotein [Paracoccus sp. M683]
MRTRPCLNKAIATLMFLPLLAACAARGPVDPQAVNDPFEAGNRRIHAFNKGLDAGLIRPLTNAVGRDDQAAPAQQAAPGTPAGPLDALANFGGNLSLPGKVLNQLLQGRPEPALRNSLRFVVNTTLGLGGIHDPAGAEFALTEIDTDFGETLYVWGFAEGPYLELPVLGPSTSRRAVGRIVDMAIDPLDNWLNRDQRHGATAIRVISKAGERARFGDTVDSVLHESADSYTQLRLLYLMNRRHELGQQGAPDDSYVIDPYEATASPDDAYVIDPYEDQ